MNNNFPESWLIAPLEECMESIIDYRGKTPQKTTFGIPLITAKIVKGGRINDIQEYIATQDYNSWMRRGIPKAGDILITTEAPLGEVAQLDNRKVALAQRLITLRGKKDYLFNDYLKFLMLSDWVQNQLNLRATRTTVLGIKQSELRKVKLLIPPLSEQKQIAHILGTLDDKIELNQRMNRTLEAIARAIFKSWFIDFDPVRAKMEGRQPEGMSKEVADLFPDSFVDSELGMIPKGWEVRQLSEVVSYLKRGIQPKYTTDKDGVLVLNQRCVRDCRIDFANARRHDSNKKSINGREVQVGDVLINSTGVGTLGRVAQVLNLEETTVVDSHVTIVRTNSDKLTWNTLGLYIYSRQLEIEALGEGSTGQTELSKDRLGLLNILIPPLLVQKYFDEQVLNVRHKTLLNDYESLTLSHIRDTLLPKLISGEIRVKQLQNIF
jgi:type I restriction enzyme S subunit